MTDSPMVKPSLQTVHSLPPSTRALSAFIRGNESIASAVAGGGAWLAAFCSIS